MMAVAIAVCCFCAGAVFGLWIFGGDCDCVDCCSEWDDDPCVNGECNWQNAVCQTCGEVNE